MRYAILSDVHSNLEALDAVLDKLRGLSVDRMISLGDTVGFNANPRECLEWLMRDEIQGVVGNHDLVAAGRMEPEGFSERARVSVLWSRGQLRPDHVRYLKALPHRLVVGGEFVACHANLWDASERINTPARVGKMFAALREHWSPQRICFFAHTHRPSAHRLKDGVQETVEGSMIDLDPSAYYLFNPGSVGESRERDPRATFAVFDSEAKRVEFHRVKFNRRSTRRKAVAAGLPQRPRFTRLRRLLRLGSPKSSGPRAVVLGLGVNGLAVVRALARKNVPVVGAYEEADEIGRYSRHCEVVPFPIVERDPEGFLRELLALGRRLGDQPVLFATSDAQLELVSREREALGKLYRFHLPEHEVLDLLMDKELVLEAASRYGIAIPRSFTFRGPEDLLASLDSLPVPCIAKPRVPWRPALGGIPKVTVLNSHEEIERFLQQHPESASDMVIQEVIEGEDDDHVFCVMYLTANHRVAGVSTGQTIHRYPPNFGRTASCVTRDIPLLAELGERFMTGERYVGLVELEFKRDRRDGKYKLFEVNTRTWAYNGLAPACGVDLVHLAYLEATGEPLLEELVRGRPGYTWLNTEMETGFLLKSLKQGQPVKFPWRVLTPRTTHSKFVWDDPRPALEGIIYRISRLLRARQLQGRARREAVAPPEASPEQKRT